MKKDISGLVLGDIHLGNNINKTIDILDNLQKFFTKYFKFISKCDFIFLNGDIFDRQLPNNSKEYNIIIGWLLELVNFCNTYSIKLRILEGTPTHDWNQAKILDTILDKSNIKIDYKYINTIYIEKNTELGINILYVPDEYRPKASDTYEDVIKLLKENNLSKVDIAMMHGAFRYQLPVTIDSLHFEDNYLNIVNKYIFINHIHNHTVYNRIIAPGSFDRLSHAEEKDEKGAIYFTIGKTDSYLFLKNTNAKAFYTFDFENQLDVEKIINTLDKKLKNIKEGSCIRILVNKDSNLNKYISSIRNRYIKYNIKIEKKNRETYKEGDIITEQTEIIESFNITKDNIKELLYKELEKYNLTPIEYKIVEEELSAIINNNI